MAGTSKILTVSYGTFSCTLEGFDDSFGTMKAIAEYFRDLAAEDRSFGVEPPAPDADILARIAERETSRSVDAHTNDSGIVLRADALGDQSGDMNAVETTDLKKQDDDSKAAIEATSKAARSARRAAKAAARAEAKAAKTQTEEKTKADAEVTEDDRAMTDDILLGSAISATDETTDFDVEETGDDTLSSALAAQGSTSDTPDADGDADHPDGQSVAAKLQRIRAVVSDTDTQAQSDDLSEQVLPDTQTPDVADTSDTNTDGIPQDLMTEFAADEDQDDEPQDDLEIDVSAEVWDADPENSGSDDPTPDADEDRDVTSPVVLPDVTASSADETAPEGDLESDTPPRARVVRMKRADFVKAGTEDTEDAAQSDDDTTSDTKTGDPDFGLLDGADDLDTYLEDTDLTDTDVAIDLDVDPEAEAVEDKATTKDGAETSVSSFLTDDPQIDDAALDRLMDETNAKMQDPEGSRRRDAISQLKAAVAAKEAARQVGETEDDGKDVEDAFRSDLSEAVPPERTTSVSRSEATSAPETERPQSTPLKLVAAQRVEPESNETRSDGPAPVRASSSDKVDKGRDATVDTAGTFAEFADSMGATELPELLEAAAAYTAFVEGVGEFSRPQILRRVRSVATDDFNREDELRSFADLISAGRFTKVRNGRFQVADDSRYKPETRVG